MRVERLRLTNVGPIQEANIEFGDLTILVGPQATGKSIFLQFLKLPARTPGRRSAADRRSAAWPSTASGSP